MENHEENRATHRQLVRIAHDVLSAATREQLSDQGELVDLMKCLLGKRHMRFRYGGEITAALDSALWQRNHR